MSKKTQRIIVIILAAALLLTVLIPALSVIVGAAVTEDDVQNTKDDIQNFKDELANIQAQKEETERRLEAVRNDQARAKEQMELIEGQVLLIESQISASRELLERYDAQIADKEQEIRGLEEQEQAQREEFYRQVRWMEETGSVSYLSILFEAASFQEFLDNATLITDIMEYSNRIINRLQATQAELAAARDELQASRDEQAEAQKELEGQRTELEGKRAEQYALLQKIAESESQLAEMARLQAESEERVNRELKDAEAKYEAQLAELERRRREAEANGGAWYWPLPGRTNLSSLFGMRYIFGSWSSHGGTDIPAPAGTPIYAANDGVVTVVYNSNPDDSTYGYHCIISHGGGYSTLYAHQCQPPIVSEGETVARGQIIGYVGTTGLSTGNHLHFELRIDGVRTDILTLYPNMTFTFYAGGFSWKGANYPKDLINI